MHAWYYSMHAWYYSMHAWYSPMPHAVLPHAAPYPCGAQRNCSWWPYDADHPERPMHFGGSPDTVLREAFVYYVDRAMGFETVPAARIVAIEPTFFARLFAPFVCTTQRQLLDDIQKVTHSLPTV